MRWPFGPPHLTLKPSKKNTPQKKANKKNNKKQEKKEAPQKNSKNTKKIAFQLSVKFFHFSCWLFKISLFWHLGPESAHPKNTIKTGVSGPFFWKADVRHETAIFGPKKPEFINFSYHFFWPIFFSFNNKNPKNCWNPYFYSVLANLKKENFQKNNLKHWKLKNQVLHPFLKKVIFRKLKNNWKQKNTNW